MNLPNVWGKSVYISGPMTHMPDHNRAALSKVETACVDAGAAEVYNPAYLIPNLDKGWERPDFMMFDLTQLLEMAKGNNMVMLQLPGWRFSTGCMTEWMVAQQLGVKCVEVIPIG